MQVEDGKGILADVSSRIADINTNITNVEAHGRRRARGRIDMTVEIRDLKHLRAGDQVAAGRRRRAGRRADGGQSGAEGRVKTFGLSNLSDAMASISMRASRGSRATCTVDRAGSGVVKNAP